MTERLPLSRYQEATFLKCGMPTPPRPITLSVSYKCVCVMNSLSRLRLFFAESIPRAKRPLSSAS